MGFVEAAERNKGMITLGIFGLFVLFCAGLLLVLFTRSVESEGKVKE